MARIAGVDLPRGKRIEIALTYIFGIGHPCEADHRGVWRRSGAVARRISTTTT